MYFPIHSYLSWSSFLWLHGILLRGHAITYLTNYYKYVLFPALGCEFSSHLIHLFQLHSAQQVAFVGMVLCNSLQAMSGWIFSCPKHLKVGPVPLLATFHGSVERFTHIGSAHMATQVGWHNLLGWHPHEELLRGDVKILHMFREGLACWNGKT